MCIRDRSCRIQNKVSFCVTAHVLTANPNICVNYFMNTNRLVSFARPLTVLLSDYFYSLITNTKTFGELCPSSSLAHGREQSPSLTFAPHSFVPPLTLVGFNSLVSKPSHMANTFLHTKVLQSGTNTRTTSGIPLPSVQSCSEN